MFQRISIGLAEYVLGWVDRNSSTLSMIRDDVHIIISIIRTSLQKNQVPGDQFTLPDVDNQLLMLLMHFRTFIWPLSSFDWHKISPRGKNHFFYFACTKGQKICTLVFVKQQKIVNIHNICNQKQTSTMFQNWMFLETIHEHTLVVV